MAITWARLHEMKLKYLTRHLFSDIMKCYFRTVRAANGNAQGGAERELEVLFVHFTRSCVSCISSPHFLNYHNAVTSLYSRAPQSVCMGCCGVHLDSGGITVLKIWSHRQDYIVL